VSPELFNGRKMILYLKIRRRRNLHSFLRGKAPDDPQCVFYQSPEWGKEKKVPQKLKEILI
jgi:hypothetical protein